MKRITNPQRVTEGRIAEPAMRFSTKLGIAALLTWAALQAVAVAIAVPSQMPTDGPAWADFTVLLEANISVNLLSRAALASGIVALLYALYKQLRREPAAAIVGEETAAAAAIPRQRLGIGAEFLLVLGLVAVLFAVNLATIQIYPMAWLDEAGYADPAINLARGYGLTSSTWYNVYWGKFWFSYPPLYPFLLASWISWLGVDFTTIRLFNVAVISGTALALWHYTRRCGLFPSLFGRVVVVLLPLLGYGVSFTYRSARPDTLCALLAVLALNASLLSDRRWRWAALIAVGSLVPWAGLQLAAFAVIVGLLIALWWPREALRVFLPLGLGMGLGLVALLGFYAANDSLYGFVVATFGSYHTVVGQIAQLVLLHDVRSANHFRQLPLLLPAVVFQERSTVFAAAAAVLLLISLRRVTEGAAFKAGRFAVAAALAIPILMELACKYSLYYTWTGLLTVGIATVACLELSPRLPALRPARRLAIGCLGLALLVGLPVQLGRAYGEQAARDYDALRAYVRARVAPGDWVYISEPPYFAVVERGGVPVLAQYATSRLAPDIPEDQRRRIKLLIVRPDEVKDAIERLGGSWRPLGPPFRPSRATRLTAGEKDDGYGYWLVAYRQE